MSLELVLIIALGTITGFGVWALTMALIPRAVPLQHYDTITTGTGTSVLEARSQRAMGPLNSPWAAGTETRVGSTFIGFLERVTGPHHITSLRQQLRILHKSPEQFVAGQVLLVTVFVGVIAAGGVTMIAFGVAVPIIGIVIAAFIAAAAGTAVPYWALHGQIVERKREFTYAFSTYLALVALHISGGLGLGASLNEAAELGEGWTWDEIRHALLRARASTHSEHRSLGALGDELGIEALQEFAGHLALAEEHGAGPEDSVVAFADSLHERLVTEITETANATTEKMSLPPVILVLGLMTFLIFGVIDGLGVQL